MSYYVFRKWNHPERRHPDGWVLVLTCEEQAEAEEYVEQHRKDGDITLAFGEGTTIEQAKVEVVEKFG